MTTTQTTSTARISEAFELVQEHALSMGVPAYLSDNGRGIFDFTVPDADLVARLYADDETICLVVMNRVHVISAEASFSSGMPVAVIAAAVTAFVL